MILWLISANELDNDYNHVAWFTKKENQSVYFAQRRTHTLDDYMYQRKNNLVFNIDLSLDEIENVNYLITINDNGKKYFYFIIDKEYINDNVSKIYLQLDVIQTYMFDIKFNECFIEREHCNRWIKYTNGAIEPLDHIEEENLETGEYVLKSESTIYNYRTKGTYIYSSSERLGVSNDGRPNFNNNDEGGESGGSSTSGDNYKNGYLDENGLVFLKSKEGFARLPYQDINGYWTTGYGITEYYQKTYYDKLTPSCTEQQASEVMGEVVYNFSSQVKNLADSIGYTLNQNKLNALTSFAYQNGVGGLQSSTIWNAIKNGKSDTEIYNLWSSLSDYNTRRDEEANIFFSGAYPKMNISNATDGGLVTDNNGKGFVPSNYQ